MTKRDCDTVLRGRERRGRLSFINLDKEQRDLHTGLRIGKGAEMNILWIVNTNTFLLVILIIMVSYLTTQVNALIRWIKRE
jgi:hypothetical protein